MKKPLKIFTASLMAARRFKAYAVYDGERLAITHILPIVGPFGLFKQQLIDEVQAKVADGFAVLIEEKTEHVSQFANRTNLEEVNEDAGRSNIYMALDWYFPMLDVGNIIVAQEYQQFMIRTSGEGQKIEKKQDEKGRAIYSVNWSSINGGHRAMLLCVIAAMNEPVSQRYVEEMLSAWLGGDEKPTPFGTVNAIIRHGRGER